MTAQLAASPPPRPSLSPSTAVRVAVIGGGTSGQHEASLASAAATAEGLALAGYQVEHLTIDRTGGWSDALGRALALDGAVQALRSCDVAIPMVHGPHGEDGTLAALCDLAGVPYVGSPVRAGAVAMDKWATKLVAEAIGLRTAGGTLATRDEASHLSGLLAGDLPLVVKPAGASASHGVSLARTEEQLRAALEVAFTLDDRVLVEEVIRGREIDIAILGRPDGTRMVAAALEVLVPDAGIFDPTRAHGDPAQFLVPAPLSSGEARKLETAAIAVYDTLGCAGVAAVDFFLTDEGPVFNEVNTAPAFTEHSPVPRMFAAAGIGYPDLLALLVTDALRLAGRRTPVARR